MFRAEFGDIADKFQIHNIALADAARDKTPGAAAPGVYVFLKGDQVLKVGRHLKNSRKRALEHIVDNTGGTMGSLRDDESIRLALFNVISVNELHWVCALEVFFEQRLQPAIRSARLG